MRSAFAVSGAMRVLPAEGSRPAVWSAAAAVLIADQVSKALALASQSDTAAHPDGGWLSVRLVRNTGASFGVGSGHPLIVTLMALIIVAAAALVLRRTRRQAAAVAWAVVLGGAVGNLADRLFRSPGPGRGAVVDWIHVAGYPPSFNLADLAIRGGVAAALVSLGLSARRPGRG